MEKSSRIGIKLLKHKSWFLVIALTAFLLLAIAAYVRGANHCDAIGPYEAEITFGSKVYNAYVADSSEERTRGLSGTDCLSKDSVMLFVFDSSATHGIWMKDMNYPIDIVWLDDNKRVVSIRSSVGPETYPEVFYPQYPARYVIELPAGTAESLGIREGEDLYWTL